LVGHLLVRKEAFVPDVVDAMAEVVCDLEQRRAERLERLVGVQAPLLLLGLPLKLARQRCQMLVERMLLLG